MPHNEMRESSSSFLRLGYRNVSIHVVTILSWFLSSPLYLLPRRGRPVKTKALHELHRLAYLDGLRGYLAITIFTCHMMSFGWKWIPDSIIAIPWLQFPFRAKYASLMMFFWISGYVVTYRIVGHIQAGRTVQLLDNMASLAFHRWFRLLLPILPVTFATTMLVSAGIATMPDGIAGDAPNKHVKDRPLTYWLRDCFRTMNPFTHIISFNSGTTGSKLLEHTWSLPAEFRSSMMLLVLCVATYKFSTRNRKILIWVAIVTFIYWEAVWASMAWMGMWFAECRNERQQVQEGHLLQQPDSVEQQEKGAIDEPNNGSNTVQPKLLRKFGLIVLFLYSFDFMKNPQHIVDHPVFPHNLIGKLLPSEWHTQNQLLPQIMIGCFMMLYPLDHIEALQWPLLLPFSQYLGELSFGIYAVHPTVIWTVRPKLSPYINDRCGPTSMDYFWCACSMYIPNLLCVLWAAELFRKIDAQIVRLLKWLEARAFEK